MGRESSDEYYVLDLCDEVLGERGLRQHRFDWLLGDTGKSGRRAKLPVDGYWPEAKIVVEYRERQHGDSVPHFDKPDRLTVSGVHRGLQRAIYDGYRDKLIPANGIRLVVITPTELAANSRGRLLRHHEADLVAVRHLLQVNLGLEDAYGDAWSERESSGDVDAWEAAVGDGFTDAER